MSDERPDALLKSALEKIVYFEARAGSLSNDLAQSRAEIDRLKAELASASQREIEVRRELAERQVRLGRSHSEKEELGRINEALRQERAALIGKMLEASRIFEAGTAEENPFDLASFISDLRSEVLGRSSEPIAFAAASSAPVSIHVHAREHEPRFAAAPPSAAVTHAVRLAAQGRLAVTTEEVLALSGAQSFPGRSEETLFGFSIRELSAPDPSARVRAAERLKALQHPASAAPIATALHAETDERVQVALMDAFATVAKEEGVAIIKPLLAAYSPDVRVTALKTLMKLSPSSAAPQLSAAMKDPDRAVRRRASLLALGLSGDAALALGEQAIADADADVRALGALVLAASSGEKARQLLVRALRDSDVKVRKAAAQSMSRIVGEDVSAVVTLDEAQRRREIRRISGLPSRPSAFVERSASSVERMSAAPASVQVRASSSEGHGAALSSRDVERAAAPTVSSRDVERAAAPAVSSARDVERSAAPAVSAARTFECAPAPPIPAPIISEALCSQLVIEVRSAIRGRTLAELSRAVSVDEAVASEACDLLVARGALVRRGLKFFTA
ncbi:MAG: HEAT repeat domain-containing protein [Myxococcaceae bacterium]